MLNRRDGFYRANLVIFPTTKTPGPNETLVLAEDECGDKNIKMFSSGRGWHWVNGWRRVTYLSLVSRTAD